MYALYTDLKTSFNSADEKKLWKKKGMDENLVKRIEEIYEGAKNRMKVGDTLSKSFYTNKGLRQVYSAPKLGGC